MNNRDTFDIVDGLQVLKRNIFIFSFSIIVCAAISVAIAFSLKKQFKSKAVLNIQSSYFQNPLINDLITEVNDPQELQSQRTSLLRLALSNSFLDSLATKYNIYSSKARLGEQALTRERDLFLKTIQYYSLSPTTFEITVTAEKPGVAQKMTEAVLERMKNTLYEERFENLTRTKTAIENHVKSLGDNIQKIASPAGEVVVQTELSKVESTLSGLLIKFTESHPEVRKLRQRQRLLSAEKGKAPSKTQEKPSDEVMASGGVLAKQPSQEVYSDLVKKLSYLTIVLDMEKDKENISYLGIIEQPTYPVQPTFPNKKLFLALGLVVGTLIGVFLSIIAELGRRTFISPSQAADLLEAPLLGELPILNTQLEGDSSIKRLPATTKSTSKTNLLSAPIA